MQIYKLNEISGVPKELLPISEKIYYILCDLFRRFVFNGSKTKGNSVVLIYEHLLNTELAGYQIKNLNFSLVLTPGLSKNREENAVISEFRFLFHCKYDFLTSKFTSVINENLHLEIIMFTNDRVSPIDIQDAFFDYPRLKPILAHELKHAFDVLVKRDRSLDEFTDYEAVNITSDFFRTFPATQNLMYWCYYLSDTESSVRPTEFAVELKQKGITKKQFKDWFMNSLMVKKLIHIRDLTLESYMEDLYEDGGERIEKFLVKNKIISQQNDLWVDDLVSEFLKFVVKFYFKKKNEIFQEQSVSMSVDDLLSHIFLKEKSPRSKYERRLVEDAEMYEKNPELFFQRVIKDLSNRANKMIKKLAGLYVLAAQDEDEISNFQEFAQKTK